MVAAAAATAALEGGEADGEAEGLTGGGECAGDSETTEKRACEESS